MQFYGALWCLSYVIYAIGNLVGVAVGSKSQNTATVCVMILFWCANGVTLKPADLSKNFGAMGRLLYAISYFRFTSQVGRQASHQQPTASAHTRQQLGGSQSLLTRLVWWLSGLSVCGWVDGWWVPPSLRL